MLLKINMYAAPPQDISSQPPPYFPGRYATQPNLMKTAKVQPTYEHLGIKCSNAI